MEKRKFIPNKLEENNLYVICYMKITAFETISSKSDHIPYYAIYTGKCLLLYHSVFLGYRIYPLIISTSLINAGLFYYYYRFLNYFNEDK